MSGGSARTVGWRSVIRIATRRKERRAMAAERAGGDQVFPKGSSKSFALVELVRGETPMVDRGPEDTEFSFPLVLLWEVLLLLGITLAVFLFSLLRQAPLE